MSPQHLHSFPHQWRKLVFRGGVVYRPSDHPYSKFNFLQQFDAVLHIDHTGVLEPLEGLPAWHEAETLGTFPTGLYHRDADVLTKSHHVKHSSESDCCSLAKDRHHGNGVNVHPF